MTAPAAGRVRMSPLRAMLVLGLLEAFGPLSIDLYMPLLPHLAASLGTSDALAQATMSACMLGLALGQLVSGPLSDRFGRRPPLVIGVTGFAAFSVLCALAPTIEVLLVARVLQGLAGSAGIVISLAVARDLFSGAELSRMLSLLLVVSGAAPIVAPLIGGQLALIMDWRGIFWVLGGVGAAIAALVVFGLPETLPSAARHAGGVRELGTNLAVLARDRLFVAVLVATVLGGTAFFTYLSMSSFVLQGQYGLTPQLFGLAFAANAVANIGGAQLSRVFVGRAGPLRMYLLGVTVTALATALLLVGVLLGMGIFGVLAGMVAYLFGSGIGYPNSSALALAHHGARAGTAAAFLGSGMFALGPIVAPLVSLQGATSLAMATTLAAASLAAALVAWFFVRPATRQMTSG